MLRQTLVRLVIAGARLFVCGASSGARDVRPMLPLLSLIGGSLRPPNSGGDILERRPARRVRWRRAAGAVRCSTTSTSTTTTAAAHKEKRKLTA